MRVIIFGATGMIGQGVLRECLQAKDVEAILTVGRTATGVKSPRLVELVHKDLDSVTAIEPRLAGYDACFYCLGVTSAGLSEAEYSRVTHDFTLTPARVLARLNPGMTFTYVSGAGTDSTEKGRTMWARVKGKTENALLALPFKGAYMFRPGAIRAVHGEVSRTTSYRILYKIFGPALRIVEAIAPNSVTDTERIGRAMLEVARKGAAQKVLESREINALAAAGRL